MRLRRTLAAGGVVVIVGLGFAACGGPGLSSGKIVARQYTPGYTDHYDDPILVGKIIVEVPETDYVNPEWQIEIKNGQQTAWIDVSHSQYDSKKTSIGKHWGATDGVQQPDSGNS